MLLTYVNFLCVSVKDKKIVYENKSCVFKKSQAFCLARRFLVIIAETTYALPSIKQMMNKKYQSTKGFDRRICVQLAFSIVKGRGGANI